MARANSKIVKVVVNSTPIITLATVGYFSLLNHLFDEIFIPTSVYEEVVVKGRNRPGMSEVMASTWINIQSPTLQSPIPVQLFGLDPGEQDVILLGQEIGADWLLIDEKLARRVTDAMGFQIKGSLGLLLIGYRTGLLSKLEALEALRLLDSSSVRLSRKLLRWFESELSKTN
ncbi:MAG: DUF3368 domain-containing protein [Anaerolineaceae bacterium]|nr:DUF3368 domain-containing protein [Anaerolineaceae bacterium]MCB9103281.1 DUF3368 domain-containing protein [Anaerolineales bacterium]